ncbi:hypothetical protein TWF506_011481 [Arthrobotrys conoides]|uniref:Protein kinase domain-containing protein n=1 Tax=Arthrobotrys conoides TaxID=74498 RepID=A0AAN8N181_9PEZI
MFNLYNLIERMREMDVTHQPQEYLQLDIRESRHGNRIEGLSNMILLSSAEGESSSALGVRSQPGQDRFDFSNRAWDFRHNFADLSQGQAEDHYPLREIFPYDEKHQLLVEWRYMSEDTEIPLTQIRLRKLIAMLQLASNIGEHKFRTLSCLGACLDEAKLRLGIAFAAPIPPDNKENTQVYISLWDKLARDFETGKVASLGYRFRLAEHVCQYVSYLLLVGWLHKGLRSDNILFLLDGKSNAIEDLKGPYLAGFEVSRQNNLGINTENIPERLVKEYATDELNLYRHPEAVIEAGEHFEYPENSPHYKPSYDLWSLGVILLEIAYWRPIDKLEAKAKDWEKFRAHLKGKHTKNLSSRVGDLYLGAVKACMSDWPDSPDERILNFDSEVLAKLKACVA